MAVNIETQRPQALQRFDLHMYQAALAFYGHPHDYAHVFKKKTKIDKATGQPVKKADGTDVTQLVSCSAPQTAKEGGAVWVQVNTSRPGTETFTFIGKDGKERQYPRRAKNEEIGTLQNITLDFEYPPDPQKALAIGKKLLDYLIAEGLAHEDQPMENSGAGPHLVLPVPAIEIADGDSAKRWNDAIAMLVHERIKPEFLRLCEQAEIVMDLSGFDISRVLSAPGTWRPYNPAKGDCAKLQQGFLRRWMAPYTNGRYPVRVENHKLKALLQECYERCVSTPKREHQAQPSEHEGSYEWLNRNAGEYYRDDRSAYFQALVGAVYQKFGGQAVLDLAQDIDRLSGGKYGDRAYEEANRSLDKAQDMPRDIKLPSPVKKRQARVNKESDLDETGDEEEKETLAEKLRRMALEQATFFRTPGGEMYAIIKRKGHEETIPLGGRGGPFKRWLLHTYAQATGGKIPNATAVSSAIDSLEAYAENEGITKEVYLRIAHYNGKIYLDLANDAMQVVEIDETGWRIVETSPVCFRQAAGMLPLPVPARGGDLKDLPRFINLHSDNDDSLLVLAWVIGFFLPNGAYPILNVHGERGAAKSTASRFLRGLVDPHQAALRKAPEDARSLAIMGHNNAIVTLDNLSHISGELSDGLCCLSTGAGDAYRTLYTDNEETIFALKRPIILNGIEEVVTRGDLLDRAITINLPEIDETQRKPERMYWQEVEQAHPRLLGAILDAVSVALRNQPFTTLDQLPRMADFALWIASCELCFSDRRGRFMEAYLSNRENSVSVELEASPLATAIEKLMEGKDEWEGMTTDLLTELKKHASDEDTKSKAWPSNARSLSGKLKRLATSFRSQGMNIHQGRDKKGSTVALQKISSAGVANDGAGVAKKIVCVTTSSQDTPKTSENGVAGVANDANLSFLTLPATQREKERKEREKQSDEREERKYQKFATFATPATPAQPLREF